MRVVGLPGGRIDEGEDAVAAAVREMEEELGVRVSASSALGLLDDYATRSGYVITPVVLWAGAVGELIPNPEEVASAHVATLAQLDVDPRFAASRSRSRPAGDPAADPGQSHPCPDSGRAASVPRGRVARAADAGRPLRAASVRLALSCQRLFARASSAPPMMSRCTSLVPS